MAIRVRIEHGQDAGKTIRLPSPGAYRFGRQPGQSFQVLDMKVSKEHFEIVIPNGTGGTPTIRDLGSTHGTLLNAQKVTAEAGKPLNPGDEIRVGVTILRVLSDGPCDLEVKATGPAPETNGPSTTTASAAGGGPANGNGGARAGAAKAGEKGKKTLPADELVGKTIAGYRVIEKVGAGGMGAVYRAEQLSLHREVALKVLSERLVSDSAFVDQFVNEARAAGQLNHPNVVQVYDVGHAEGRHYFSMEFIEGGALEGKIPRTGGGVPWQDALPWFLDAANALIFAEKKGILHRDIKPDNFMLSQDGSVKLCDLGLAKKSESADLLAQGIIGTPHFISPEAIRRRNDVDKRSDLYSLGCTFFRLLTGRNPYPAGNVKDILLAQLNSPVPRVSEHASDVPKELDEVVFKLMQKEASARFQSAEELWKALDKIRLQFGMEAHGLHPGRAKKVAIVAGVLGVAAIGVAVYFVFIRETPVETRETVKVVGEEATRRAKQAEREANARSALSEIRLDAATRIGPLEEKWSDPLWPEVVGKLRKLATDYHDTPSAPEATDEADKIETYVREQKQKQDEIDLATREAKAGIDSLRKDLNQKVSGLRGEKKWFEADAEVAKAAKRVDEDFAKQEKHGKILLDEDFLKLYRDAFDGLRKAFVSGLEQDWQDAEAKAKAEAAKDTVPAMNEAVAILQRWLTANPERPKTETDLEKKLADCRTKAQSAIDAIQKKVSEAFWKDRRADREVHQSTVKTFFAAKSETSEGGLFVRFQFAEALARATKARADAKTPEYQRLLDAYVRQATLLRDLFASFPEAFKGIKDVVQGRETQPGKGPAWKGAIKEVKGDSVVTSDGKEHFFKDEGIAWIFDLVYDAKADKERIPLSADAHEALGALAFAGLLAENGSLGDRALTEWKRAAEMDAARKDDLDRRGASVDAERKAREAWEECEKDLDEINLELDKWEKQVDDPAKANEFREEFKTKVADRLKKDVADLRARVKAVAATHGSTLTYAARVDSVPANATYYPGEEAPPALPPPPPPTAKPPRVPPGMGGPPPTPPSTPPAMDGGAMDGNK